MNRPSEVSGTVLDLVSRHGGLLWRAIISKFALLTPQQLANIVTDILFVSPDFLSGLGRSVDIGAALDQTNYNMAQTPAEADERAIRNDFEVVGKDLEEAIERVAEDL